MIELLSATHKTRGARNSQHVRVDGFVVAHVDTMRDGTVRRYIGGERTTHANMDEALAGLS